MRIEWKLSNEIMLGTFIIVLLAGLFIGIVASKDSSYLTDTEGETRVLAQLDSIQVQLDQLSARIDRGRDYHERETAIGAEPNSLKR